MDTNGEDLVNNYKEIIRRIRVAHVTRGPKKKEMLLYYGRVDKLHWDPERFVWKWEGEVPFMSYNTKMGRLMLRRHHKIPLVVEKKWPGILPPSFKLRWSIIWEPYRVKKEGRLLWAIWHRSVAVNEWRGKISTNVDQQCEVCKSGAKESVLHRFWECQSATIVWTWGTRVLEKLGSQPLVATMEREGQGTPGSPRIGDLNATEEINLEPDMVGGHVGRRVQLNWKQSIFAQRIQRRFRKCSRIWN